MFRRAFLKSLIAGAAALFIPFKAKSYEVGKGFTYKPVLKVDKANGKDSTVITICEVKNEKGILKKYKAFGTIEGSVLTVGEWKFDGIVGIVAEEQA